MLYTLDVNRKCNLHHTEAVLLLQVLMQLFVMRAQVARYVHDEVSDTTHNPFLRGVHVHGAYDFRISRSMCLVAYTVEGVGGFSKGRTHWRFAKF